MARPRIDLHALIQRTVGEDVRVYFQPPADIKMSFPCIVYERVRTDTRFANDNPYLGTKRYTLTSINRDPDSEIPELIATLPMCTHSSYFVTNNLNHDVFDIFF